ncbi:hypothetical protein F511_03539 [Dorcoceras hygrometricum]|uniref:Uncharacterized protein n=1 Tax=Dorcoceras hygrometricum TaxID=472368 RepID=A0A2Z7ABA3_9LAMI|nr:hypothetical protein F511_03539 [Dorcoceras hygrometricum]
MVRPIPIPIPIHASGTFSSIPLAIGLFVSVSLLVALCAKHARQIPRKCASKTTEPNTPHRSPLVLPKQLKTSLGSMAIMSLVHGRKSGPDSGAGKEDIGVWQKAILMGEKCQPPEFSGAIYYDYDGNRIPEMPKSPRAGPLRGFTFHVEKNDHLDV